jgi:hypothetical protein
MQQSGYFRAKMKQESLIREDVADAMVDVILALPANGIVDIVGPEKIALDEFVRRFLLTSQDARSVVTDNEAGYFSLAKFLMADLFIVKQRP